MQPGGPGSPAPRSAASVGTRACTHRTTASGPTPALHAPQTSQSLAEMMTHQLAPPFTALTLSVSLRILGLRSGRARAPLRLYRIIPLPCQRDQAGACMKHALPESPSLECSQRITAVPLRTSASTSGMGSEATWAAVSDRTPVRYLSAACVTVVTASAGSRTVGAEEEL